MSQDSEQPELIDHDAARRNGRRIVALVVAVMILSAAVGLAVSFTHPRHNGHHHQGFVGVLIVLAGLVLLAGITVPLLLHVYKRPNFARMLQFSWGRRRRVTKALRKGRPVLPALRR